jgi:hypothetical protein
VSGLDLCTDWLCNLSLLEHVLVGQVLEARPIALRSIARVDECWPPVLHVDLQIVRTLL